jgi:hypothetical protein
MPSGFRARAPAANRDGRRAALFGAIDEAKIIEILESPSLADVE